MTAPPLLGLFRVPPDLRPALENVLARVWTGRVAPVEAPAHGDPPTLVVIGAHTIEALAESARACDAAFPEIAVLAFVPDARKLRNQRGALPTNVAWALWTDEIDPRIVGLALRYAIEVGARRLLAERLQAVRPMADMGWIASSVAHEVGNPLTGLLTNLDLLRAQVADAARTKAALDPAAVMPLVVDALDGARHISRIAGDLGRASRQHGRVTTVEVRSVLDTARRLASELLSGIEVKTKFLNVPLVRVDETRLCQVFLNLLKNAAHALKAREGATIELELDVEPHRVVVRISDNGPGIPDVVLKRLFEPWQTTKAEGTGIGLALCRRYLAEMGATIEHHGGPGEGARFEIKLQISGTRPSRPTLVPDLSGGTARILVVDDTALVRRGIKRALQATHTVEEAEDVDAALKLLETQRYDVVLVDLHMPKKTGLMFYEEVTERFPDRVRKVVFLSGAFGGDDLAYLEQRNLPWVRKPVGADELRALVAELVNSA